MTVDPKKLGERRRRARAYSDWDVINAIRQILGLDPIAEKSGKRGMRKETEKESP